MVYPEITTWTPSRTLADILAMRKQAADVFHWGPYILLTSPAWAPYLDQDFKTNGDITLRERILKITEITSIQQADYLTGYQMVLVQLTSDVIRLVNGMDITTVQWDTEGGFKANFKVLAMWVPQVRNDAAGATGIVHGVAT